MREIAVVEDDEIVIRVPISALAYNPGGRDFEVTDCSALAPHVARELGAEDMGEVPYIEAFVEQAVNRAVEGDAPGVRFLWFGQSLTKEPHSHD